MAGLQLDPVEIQVLQDLTILVFAPLVSGVVAHLEARLQGRRGPRILQPYYDIGKLFSKETLVPQDASWVFLAGPVVAFACYLTVPLLIPVLTQYPLPLGYMGDILGGGSSSPWWASPSPSLLLRRAGPTRSSAAAGQ